MTELTSSDHATNFPLRRVLTVVLPDGVCLPNFCLPGSSVVASGIWLNDGSVKMGSNRPNYGIVITILEQLAEGEQKFSQECETLKSSV